MTYDEFYKEWTDISPEVKVRTSGSTGKPKCITLKKDFMRDSAMRTVSFFGIDSDSRLYSCISADTIGGKMMMVRSIIANCEFLSEEPSNRPMIKSGDCGRISVVSVVASQMVYITAHADEFRHVDTFILGGSPVDRRLRSLICDSGLNIYESYGMTESASHIALRKIDSIIPGPFYPLPGISVEIDSRGCLVIDFGKETSVVTNDMAELTPDGGFFITGRYDSMIITGGKKVNPIEAEGMLSEIIDNPFLITSRPDVKWGSRIVLLIERDQKGDKASEKVSDEEICRRAHIAMPHYMVPKEVIFVDHLPTLPNGKYDRKPLPED